jgi:hypothetical protein
MSRFYKKITAHATPSSLEPHTIQNALNGPSGASCTQAIVSSELTADNKTVFSSINAALSSGATSICVRDGDHTFTEEFYNSDETFFPPCLNVSIAKDSTLTIDNTELKLQNDVEHNLLFSGPGTLRDLNFNDFTGVKMSLTLKDLLLEGTNTVKAGNAPGSYLDLVNVRQTEQGSCVDIEGINQFTTLNIDSSNLALAVSGTFNLPLWSRIHNSVLNAKPGETSVLFDFTEVINGLQLTDNTITSNLEIQSADIDSAAGYSIDDVKITHNTVYGSVIVRALNRPLQDSGELRNILVQGNKIVGDEEKSPTLGLVLSANFGSVSLCRVSDNQTPSISLVGAEFSVTANVVSDNVVVQDVASLVTGPILFTGNASGSINLNTVSGNVASAITAQGGMVEKNYISGNRVTAAPTGWPGADVGGNSIG